MSLTQAKLWVVATPLGNPGDMSPRAVKTLESAGLILAEDTRRAGLLCQRLGIDHGRMVSSFDHNENSRIPLVLETLAQGRDVALISDAGTPLIADPGYVIVRACRQAGFPVSPVPGPCAPIAALMTCGLPSTPFTFLGFLPRKPNDIRATLTPFADVQTTLVFFERKNRLAVSLGVAREVLGGRLYCVARELTKTHEECITGSLDNDQDLERLATMDIRGECTVVIGPADVSRTRSDESRVRDILREELAQGGKPRAVAKRVAARVSGWSAKDVYAMQQVVHGRTTSDAGSHGPDRSDHGL
ncbi:16S rRNA (cytidine(1402)-2'-O)-methyltransferase [Desulfoplanes formicivorans]|uniref:Ribosomal RNA small subunit methyltransferase I n=1 Tax=Desulfoplanes formicivorans TaxID=1592317 RepID=A0A194AKX2_9BACT|nr:16S rRNA (cytidine(1402)-2'-O)-methyltransferase [Desulfoplanes formicivorans]GAU09963.1 rRNA (cytidine-2'-O-)-methyltransferase [Desulfoplanes formicivorans]